MSYETEKTAQRMFELLDYNPETGEFTWKTNRRGKMQQGKKAGCLHPHGYIRITVDYRLFNAQRIAWLFITGKWPSKNIDHIDGNRSNNKANNLRECDQTQNNANRKLSKSNTSGFKGVSFIKTTGKWAASIKKNGKSKNLGTFNTPQEAHDAYKKAADQIFCMFARHQ